MSISTVRRKLDTNDGNRANSVQRAYNKVNETRMWWKGMAGDTFRDEWELDVNYYNHTISSNKNYFRNALNRLDDKVERAKREERAERRDRLNQR